MKASQLHGAYRTLRRGARRLQAWAYPVTADAIQRVLLVWEPREILFVHSSLSACGHVRGGAATVVDALRNWCAGKTLAMPTHTYCYPDKDGRVAVFDPAATRSVVGTITDAFWRRSRVLRSLHPTHSLAAEGLTAAALIEGHERCATPCGAGTPYARMVEWDASVLMFGATLDSYTLFHTAEDAAGVPYLYYPEPYRLKIRGRNGGQQEVIMQRQDMTVPRRFGAMADWLAPRGLLHRRALGRGALLYIPSAKAVHNALVDVLKREPTFLTAHYTAAHV